MKKTYFFLILLFSVSCSHTDVKTVNVEPEEVFYQSEQHNQKFQEYKIDGCEYIGTLKDDTRGWFLTHKGNCKNIIHD